MENLNMVVEPVRNFVFQLGEFLPRLLGTIIILIVGWLVAKFLAFIVVRSLKLVRFNVLTELAGMDSFLKQGGVKKTTIDILGLLVYWLVILITLLAGFNVLGLSVVSDLFRSVALFIPNVMVAVLILAIGLYIARLVSDSIITYGKNVGLEDVELLGRLLRYGIMAFVVIIALGQMNVGQSILVPAFLILFGGVCLAGALAFGLGGQKWAAGALDRFMEKSKKR